METIEPTLNNEPTITPQTVQYKNTLPKNKTKWFLIIGLIIFFLLVVVGALAYVFVYQNKENTEETATENQEQVPSPVAQNESEKILYEIPKSMDFTPTKEYEITKPFYTVDVYGYTDISVKDDTGKELYIGKNYQRVLETYENLPEVRIDSMGTEGANDILFEELISQKYTVTLSEGMTEEIPEDYISIMYGYGNREESIYFSLIFLNTVDKNGTFEFEITKEGVRVSKDFTPLAVTKSSSPIDATPPIIEGLRLPNSTLVDVNFSDERGKILSKECTYFDKRPGEIEEGGYFYNKSNPFKPYEGPMEPIKSNGDLLICQAWDNSGNITWWTGEYVSDKMENPEISSQEAENPRASATPSPTKPIEVYGFE